MKTYYLLLLSAFLIFCFVLSCNNPEINVKELTKEFTLEELDYLIRRKLNVIDTIEYPIDKSRDLEKRYQEILDKVPIDTLLLAIDAHYGITDDRKDFNEITNSKVRENAFGVALMVRSDQLQYHSGYYTLLTQSLKEAKNTCSNSKFSTQPTSGFCSAFAVSKNIIVTAGHCLEDYDINNPSESNIKFLFGFKKVNSRIPYRFSKENVFTIKEIISIQRNNQSNLDYAVIRTNEDISSEKFLSIDTNFVKENLNVYTIGHPSHLPLKVADNAFVRSDGINDFQFRVNLDAFGGNSGSPVFSVKNDKVVGVLVDGEIDYVYDSRIHRQCYVPYPCSNYGCKGEGVSRVNQFFNHISDYLE